MLTSVPNSSREDRIRAEFEQLGGAISSRLFAEHLLATGFYDDEFLESAAIKAIQSDIRKALKSSDGAGLPFACAVGRGAEAVWKQRDLMEYDEYAAVIGDLSEGVRADYRVIVGLHGECRLRFGRAPEIPELIDPPSWRNTAAD